jgi:hypothetical protein
LVWLIHHNRLPARLEHIDGDRMNTRIENLREWKPKPKPKPPPKPRKPPMSEKRRRAKKSAYDKAYRAKHGDQLRAREAELRRENLERARAKGRRHYDKHKRVERKPPVYLPEKGIIVHGSGKLKGQPLGGNGKGTPKWKLRWEGQTVSRDRLVWFLETGEWPPERGPGTLIHINGDDLDDRFVNLAIRDGAWAWVFNMTAEEKAAKRKRKYESDPVFKARLVLRSHINRLGDAVKKGKSFLTCERLLGYSVGDFMEHMESRFEPGMTWENWGRGGWNVGHIISVDWYTKSGVADPAVVHALSNLFPQWELDNFQLGPRLHHIGPLFEHGRKTQTQTPHPR